MTGVGVKVRGERIPPEVVEDLEAVTVEEDLDALSMFTLELHNWDEVAMETRWSESDLFAIGNEVEISIGDQAELTRVMAGEITGLDASFGADRPAMLTVRGYDHRHRLARGRRTRTFKSMTDAAIAEQIARDAGLGIDATDAGAALDYVVQSNQSDLEFLKQRAALVGNEMYVADKVLHFHPPRHTRKATMVLEVGHEIIEFTPRLSTLRQVGKVAIRGWDVAHKKVVVGVAAAGQESPTRGGSRSGPLRTSEVFGPTAAVTVDVGVQSQQEADNRAVGLLTEVALGYIEAEADCEGDSQLRAGTVVEIAGAGKTFSGDYYVTAVSHSVTSSAGYRSQLKLRRSVA